MKKVFFLIFIILILFNCKSGFKNSDHGSFRIENYSEKIIEFIWIAPEGEFYQTVKSINIGKDQIYEVQGLEVGMFDIAIDFKDEYNSFNSKKDKSLCFKIEKGLTTAWSVDSSGKINRN